MKTDYKIRTVWTWCERCWTRQEHEQRANGSLRCLKCGKISKRRTSHDRQQEMRRR